MRKKVLLFLILVLSLGTAVFAQDDLLDMLDEEVPQKKEFTYATFKGVRLINGHTVEAPSSHELVFLIGHRFGRISDGVSNLFGLDQATIRLGLEYSLSDRFCAGIGRSTYQKTVDGFLKYKLIKQAKGKGGMPFSLTLLSSTAINTLRWPIPDRKNYFTSRLAYTHQLLLARKFNAGLSLQLMPTVVHKNLVEFEHESNDVYALGAGGRVKLTRRISLNAEYYYLLNRNSLPNVNGIKPKNALAVGFDIETGGHVFQLHFTNAQAMMEKGFITETTGDFFKGDIYFGFNVSRTFSFKRFAKTS